MGNDDFMIPEGKGDMEKLIAKEGHILLESMVPEDGISEDYTLLERRMEHFLGLHYTEDTIENGMDRLSIVRPPFNKMNVDSINKKMLAMSGERASLKERWNRSLAVYDKLEVVDEDEVADKFSVVK